MPDTEQHFIAPICATCSHEIDKDERGQWFHVAATATTSMCSEPEPLRIVVPRGPALIYCDQLGTACFVDLDQFDPSMMSARDRALCRALLMHVHDKIAAVDRRFILPTTATTNGTPA